MSLKGLVSSGLYKSPIPVAVTETVLFYAVHRYWPSVDAPRTFAEKVVRRKMRRNYRIPLAELSNKLAVRDYVAHKVGEEYLIPLLFSGSQITAEQLFDLGDNIVVKLNNDCNSAQIIRENSRKKAAEVCDKINQKRRRDFGRVSNQWWYSEIEPKVMVEQLLQDWDAGVPIEYQLFMFRDRKMSVPSRLFSVVFGRGTEEHGLNYFDKNGEQFLFDNQPISSNYENGGFEFPHPDLCKELVKIGDVLSEGIDHVRVDLYIAKDQIYFGEMTFSSGGGRIRWKPREFDEYLGSLWDYLD